MLISKVTDNERTWDFKRNLTEYDCAQKGRKW